MSFLCCPTLFCVGLSILTVGGVGRARHVYAVDGLNVMLCDGCECCLDGLLLWGVLGDCFFQKDTAMGAIHYKDDMS